MSLSGWLLFSVGAGCMWTGMGKLLRCDSLNLAPLFRIVLVRSFAVIFTYLAMVGSVIAGITYYSWLMGIIYSVVLVFAAMFVTGLLFPDHKDPNPAPPLFIGILLVFSGVVLVVM
jgi:uncharacterized membrane protein YoaK (UPF0700 family)